MPSISFGVSIHRFHPDAVLVVLFPIEEPAPSLNWRRVSGLRCVGVGCYMGRTVKSQPVWGPDNRICEPQTDPVHLTGST